MWNYRNEEFKSKRGTFKWNDLCDGVSEEQKNKIKGIQSSITMTDVCNIQFTSGTTSQPKGVLLTHLGVMNTPHFYAKHINLYEKHHKVCLQVPLFHVYGLEVGILGTFLTGSTLVIPSSKFSPSKSIDCIISEKCTLIHGAPTMYTDLLTISLKRFTNEPDIFEKMSSIEVFVSAGAVCLPEVAIRLKKYFKNAGFTSAYGMTETTGIAMMSEPWDSEDVISPTTQRIMDHVEVKIVDDNDEIVPLGVPGEMCVKGYLVMKEYYKEPEKTKAVLKNGWLHTGDKFVLLENGYAEITGRIKDIIIRGAEKIEPKEIEEVLSKHPEIIDVQVYGISDSRLGEVVAAAIIKTEQSNLSQHSVQTYCRNIIAAYKIPQHVTFVSEFPKTPSGKIQKFKLREKTESVLNKKA